MHRNRYSALAESGNNSHTIGLIREVPWARCYDGQTEVTTVLIIYYYETLHECAVYQ